MKIDRAFGSEEKLKWKATKRFVGQDAETSETPRQIL